MSGLGRARSQLPWLAYSPKPTLESRANRFMYATRPSTMAVRPSSVSSWCVPCEPELSACSRASALAGETLAAMIGPPAKATSMRTESDGSGNGYDLRENAVNGVGMDKGDLQAEEADARNRVDQLDAVGSEALQGETDIVDLVGEMMNTGSAPGEKAADRRVLVRRRKQLDPAASDEDGRRLNALLGDDFAVLKGGAEGAEVRLDGHVEVGNGDTDVMKARGVHVFDATARRPARAAAGWRR